VFEMGSFDGVVGLGFSHLAINGITPVFDALQEQHFKDKPKMFSVFMDKTPGSTFSALYFGGVDSSKAAGEWTFHNVDSSKGYWWVKLNGIQVGEDKLQACQGGCNAAIDTGTSIITGPKEDVQEISDRIVEKIKKDCSNYDELPSITFTIDEKQYDIQGKDYILFLQEKGESICIFGVKTLDIAPPKGPMFILGDIFLRKYYSLYDHGSDQNGPRVAFAKSTDAEKLHSAAKDSSTGVSAVASLVKDVNPKELNTTIANDAKGGSKATAGRPNSLLFLHQAV